MEPTQHAGPAMEPAGSNGANTNRAVYPEGEAAEPEGISTAPAVGQAADDLLQRLKSEPLDNGGPPVVPQESVAEDAAATPTPGEDLAEAFADLYSAHLESPWQFFYFAFLTHLGAMVSRMVTLKSALKVQPRLYTVLLGESADTRKSTALIQTRDFFSGLLPVKTPWHTLLGIGSAEGLGLALSENPAPTILAFDEFKAFVDKAKIDGSVLLQMVNTLFEDVNYGNRTKKETIDVQGASVSILAASTKETFETMFTQAFMSIGFLNRLWLVPGGGEPRRFSVPKETSTVALATLREKVKAVLTHVYIAYVRNGERPVEYAITPEAFRLFDEWYHHRSGSIFEKRLDTYGHRLALLLAVAKGKREVDEAVMREVLIWLGRELVARRDCDPIDADNTVARMEEKIRRLLANGPAKITAVKHKSNYSRWGLWVWDKALANLIRSGEITKSTDLEWVRLNLHQFVHHKKTGVK